MSAPITCSNPICRYQWQLETSASEDAVLRWNPNYGVSAVTASIAAEGDAGTVYRSSPQEPWRVLRTRLRKEGVVRGQVEGMTTFTSATD